MKFEKMKLKYRFISLFAVLALGFGVYGVWSFKTLNELKVNGPLYQQIVQGKDLIADVLPPPEYIIESYLVALQIKVALPEERKSLIENFRALKADYDTRHAYWVKENLDSAVREELLNNADKPAQEFYRIAFERFLPAIALDDTTVATAAFESMQKEYLLHRAAINNVVELVTKRNESDEANAKAVLNTSTSVMLLILLGAMGLAVVLSWRIARSILLQVGGELAEAVSIAGKIAAGDITVEVVTKPGDQTSLMVAMKVMCSSLLNVINQVRTSTDTIATASTQITAGNLNFSTRTEQQASALEETASSMEELTSTVGQNADNARQASQLANSASEVASKGGVVVSEVVRTMESINESSKKIVDIISVIDGIAFQTNILALNAAVEAARAGEQGRGFAVVAAEVRSLAQRSANAAKEIKVLITDSVDKVDAGSELVTQAGGTMEEIVSSVRRVTDIISEITVAADAQQAGIEQINQAIEQMNTVTQQNAALVEEAAAAAESLQGQARDLVQTVSIFKCNK